LLARSLQAAADGGDDCPESLRSGCAIAITLCNIVWLLNPDRPLSAAEWPMPVSMFRSIPDDHGADDEDFSASLTIVPASWAMRCGIIMAPRSRSRKGRRQPDFESAAAVFSGFLCLTTS
jgi:hypothetical protein